VRVNVEQDLMETPADKAATESSEAPRAEAPESKLDAPSDDSDRREEQRVDLPADGEVRYCRRCQEPLSFFSTGPWHCWKCDLEFDPRRPKSYLRRRALLRWKFWFPGFCLAVSCGMLGFGLWPQSRELVTPTIIAAAIIVGCLLGYGAPIRVRVYVMLFVVLIMALMGVVATGSPLGMIGGIALSIVLLFPVILGIAAGVILRHALTHSNWDQRWYFP